MDVRRVMPQALTGDSETSNNDDGDDMQVYDENVRGIRRGRRSRGMFWGEETAGEETREDERTERRRGGRKQMNTAKKPA